MEGNLSTISAKKPVNIVNPQGRSQLSAAQLNTKSIANSHPLVSQASFIKLLLNLHLFLVLLPLVMCDLHISLPENQAHNHIQQLCFPRTTLSPRPASVWEMRASNDLTWIHGSPQKKN